MSHMKDLLGDSLFEHTHTRLGNPRTSRAAARETAIRAATQRAKALAVWQRYPDTALTSDKASALDGYPDDRYHQRVSDLIREGRLVDTKLEEPSRRGAPQRLLKLRAKSTI